MISSRDDQDLGAELIIVFTDSPKQKQENSK